MARVRLAIFNSLGTAVEDADVIDLYAGAGTLGFEALSRGASTAVFVEHNEQNCRIVHNNAVRLGCAAQCVVVRSDVLTWLRANATVTSRAGVAFIDPPYRAQELLLTALNVLASHPPSIVVCEYHRRMTVPEHVGMLECRKRGVYGETEVSIFDRE